MLTRQPSLKRNPSIPSDSTAILQTQRSLGRTIPIVLNEPIVSRELEGHAHDVHDKVERWIEAAMASRDNHNALPNPQPPDLREARAARVKHAVELARKASANAIVSTSCKQFFIPELESHIQTSVCVDSQQSTAQEGPVSPTSPTSVTSVLDAFAALVSPQLLDEARALPHKYLVTM